MSDFNLKFVDFDYTKDVNSFHFYPDRKFDAETIVFLYRKESFGNGQFLNYFYECDKKNIKVNVFCSHNFFPLASLVSHSCYTEMPSKSLKFLEHDDRLSRYCCELTQLCKHSKSLGIEHLLPIKYERKDFLNEIPDHPICPCDPQCKTARDHEKKILRGYKIESVDKVEELYHFFKSKPIHLSAQFLDHFNNIKNNFDSDRVCVELKPSSSPRAVEFLSNLNSNKIVNIDKKFVWEFVNKYELGQSYLSFQFLMSAYKKWRYIALGGAANVMQSFYPINTLVFWDSHSDGACPNMILLKMKLNKYFYGEEPIGLTIEGKKAYSEEQGAEMRARGENASRAVLNDLEDHYVDIVRNKILCYI